jgi:hypothetical protein
MRRSSSIISACPIILPLGRLGNIGLARSKDIIIEPLLEDALLEALLEDS